MRRRFANIISHARPDVERSKKLTRRLVVAFCRTILDWSAKPFPVSPRVMMVFAPHQDDETLACGGLIARKRNEGFPVHVVFITDGCASHPAHPRLNPAEIAILRRAEALKSLAVLGVESHAIHFLDESDGTLNQLTEARRQALVERIRTLLRTVRPAEILLPLKPDGSTEHDAAFDFVTEAIDRAGVGCDLWQYPVWMWWNPRLLLKFTFQAHGHCRLPVQDFYLAKRDALRCYRSQTKPLAPWTEPALSAELLRLFNFRTEYFLRYNRPLQPNGGSLARSPSVDEL